MTQTTVFRKLLIANRGEIAVRLVRACRDLGISPVVVYSEVDRSALHVRLADEAYDIGPANATESYLRVDKIMDVARRAGCDALHPGYGFLAENPALPRACAQAKVIFVGPSAEAMERLGSKTSARQLAYVAGVPMVPGVREPIENAESAESIAGDLGYPVLLKAVAGGGGKGMRLVWDQTSLLSAWRDAGSEALNAFGDSRLYLEKYLERPRHIEIQFFADTHGNAVYLGERECSIQRRHQKVIEEAPSLFAAAELRQAMGQATLRLARAAGYVNAGTAEFLVDARGNFFFLEVNTRLQVEHPVTEAVTGIDLVKLQLLIAAGEPLPFNQQNIGARGHAIECRIYAEDPDNNFFPSPGKITSWRLPSGPGIRVDEGVYSGWSVPGNYDPLLAKLIATGADRAETIARMRRALAELDIGGIKTNVRLLARILSEPDFVAGEFHTRWLDDWLIANSQPPAAGHAAESNGASESVDAATIAAVLWHMRANRPIPSSPGAHRESPWKSEGRRAQLSRYPERSS